MGIPRRSRSYDAEETCRVPPAFPTTNWRAEGLTLAQGEREVIYKALAPESEMAVSDSGSKGVAMGQEGDTARVNKSRVS